ncbi:MAG: PspA-associated protein PspAA [Methanotrichaceae archaeon]
MIIRIMGEGQFQVPSVLLDELNVIDNRIVDYVAQEDEEKYRRELSDLITTIKAKGSPLDLTEIVESDIIVPPEDLALDEAKKIFAGSGLIED